MSGSIGHLLMLYPMDIGTDPFRDMPRFLKQLQDLGFAGVQNFPTVGLIDGTFRANLEETDMVRVTNAMTYVHLMGR